LPVNVAKTFAGEGLIEVTREYHKSVDAAKVLDLPVPYSVSIWPVTNSIYRSAVPALNYLLERRSATFQHHYSPEPNQDVSDALATKVWGIPEKNQKQMNHKMVFLAYLVTL